jgi:hypothetical protein
MGFFGTDDEAFEERIEELEAQLKIEKREHNDTLQELQFLQNLQYEHRVNVEKEEALSEQQSALDRLEAKREAEYGHKVELAEAEYAKQKAVFEASVAARTTELDRRQVSLEHQADELDDREEELVARETSADNGNYKKGFAEGYSYGVAEMSDVRDADRQHYGEILKLHAIGQFMPKTVQEGDKNPLAEAYGKLGAEMVDKLMASDKAPAKTKE